MNNATLEISEKPEPAAIMQLPTLSIQIRGEVTVSNLPEFKQAADTFISSIKTDLQTDDDFVNAEATVKFCDETERKLESAKAAAIGQTASIDELMRTIDHIKESIRQKRLTLEKLVKSQKESIKKKIIDDGFLLCEQHTVAINYELINYISIAKLTQCTWSRQNFELACRGLRTLQSLHNAVDKEVAAIKIKLDDQARVIRKNLTHLPEDLSLFRDLESIITKPEDDFKLLVESRLAEQKRKQEEEKQRAEAAIKAAEEQAKKQAEEKAKADIAAAEERGRAQQAAIAERERNSFFIESSAKPSVETNQPAVVPEQSNVKAIGINTTHEKRTVLQEVSKSFIEFGVDEKTARNITALIFANQIKHVTINFQP